MSLLLAFFWKCIAQGLQRCSPFPGEKKLDVGVIERNCTDHREGSVVGALTVPTYWLLGAAEQSEQKADNFPCH